MSSALTGRFFTAHATWKAQAFAVLHPNSSVQPCKEEVVGVCFCFSNFSLWTQGMAEFREFAERVLVSGRAGNRTQACFILKPTFLIFMLSCLWQFQHWAMLCMYCVYTYSSLEEHILLCLCGLRVVVLPAVIQAHRWFISESVP